MSSDLELQAIYNELCQLLPDELLQCAQGGDGGEPGHQCFEQSYPEPTISFDGPIGDQGPSHSGEGSEDGEPSGGLLSLRYYGEDCDLLDFDAGRTLISSIHPNTVETRQRLTNYFTACHEGVGRPSNCTSVIAAIHDDHIHVVHGCNAARRCQCFARIPQYARKRLNTFAFQSSITYRQNMRDYLVSGPGKRHVFLWSNRLGWSQLMCRDPPQNMGFHDELMEDGINIYGAPRSSWNTDVLRCVSGGSEQGNQLEDQGSLPADAKEWKPIPWLEEQLRSEWASSIQPILSSPVLNAAHMSRITYGMKRIQDHFKHWRITENSRTLDWCMDDILEEFGDRLPSFGVASKRMASVEDSMHALKDFLFTHFTDNWKQTFLDICNIFDRRSGKQNSLCFVGPVSCGKTWFMNGFGRLARFVGTPKNFIRGDRFSWNDCQNSRLLRFDECTIPIDAMTWIEKFKEICGGQETEVDTKFGTNYVLYPTPVFISSNRPIFQNNQSIMHEFVPSRMLYLNLYPWPQASEMTGHKELNPVALLLLKKELEIQEI